MSGCSGRDDKYGEGFCIGHAGELLQGAMYRDAEAEPFLVTLPAPTFVSRATVQSNGGADTVNPAWKTKALQAARLAWNDLGGSGTLRLNIESETPVGRGCGSSTSDCVAAIRAVSDLMGHPCKAEKIASWSTQAEVAADSTMFDLLPVAFQQRGGKLLRLLGEAFPPMRIIAIDLGGSSVDTVSRKPPAYTKCEMDTFEELLANLEDCIQRRDTAGVARVASKSAAIHQRYYPHPQWNNFLAVADGALGTGCSHSGNLAIILLAPEDDWGEQRILDSLRRERLPTVARYLLNAGEEGSCRSF